MPGAQPHPRALRAKRAHFCARKQQQGSRNSRHSLRNGFNAYTCSPRCPGFLATVPLGSRRVGRKADVAIPEVDPSVGGSGRHDFAVRVSRARLSRRRVHRIPPPTFVTIAKRPSSSERDGHKQPQYSEKRKKFIFAGGA